MPISFRNLPEITSKDEGSNEGAGEEENNSSPEAASSRLANCLSTEE